jgi:hypothetical protein
VRYDVTDLRNDDELITAYYLGDDQLISLAITKTKNYSYSTDGVPLTLQTPKGKTITYYINEDQTQSYWSKGDLHYTLYIEHHKDRNIKDNTFKPSLETLTKIIDSVHRP